MTDYISREAALELLDGIYDCNDMVFRDNDSCVGLDCGSCRWRDTRDYIRDRLTRIPAADVAPVRHGRWIDKCVRDWRCSECGGEIYKVRHVDGYYYDNLPRYCPDCGALMDKDGDGDV